MDVTSKLQGFIDTKKVTNKPPAILKYFIVSPLLLFQLNHNLLQYRRKPCRCFWKQDHQNAIDDANGNE